MIWCGIIYNMRRNKGFTLIELLVVISIIGLLSSIVLASLNSAKLKANDAATMREVQQFAVLLHYQFNETRNYSSLQTGAWRNDAASCESSFSGTYAEQAREICKNIVSRTISGPGGGRFYIGSAQSMNTTFSIMAWLQGKGRFYCVGSSGGTSATVPIEESAWVGAGCYANP